MQRSRKRWAIHKNNKLSVIVLVPNRILDLLYQNFESAVTPIFKDLRKLISKDLKESVKITSQQSLFVKCLFKNFTHFRGYHIIEKMIFIIYVLKHFLLVCGLTVIFPEGEF